MKYPYIGKSNAGIVTLFANANAKIPLIVNKHSTIGVGICYTSINESHYANITREYLEGKCVKIESPEHGEFVAELCKNNSIGPDKHDNKPWAYIEDGELYFTSSVGETDRGDNFEEITIPLPPKEPLNENGFNLHFAGDKCEEWRVGDKVTWENEALMGSVLAVNGNKLWIKDSLGSYLTCNKESVIKPKTEAEILRDEIMELIIKQMESKSEPISFNAYYIFSDLMDKYNITKKPQ